jgi:spore photoproduct lyase
MKTINIKKILIDQGLEDHEYTREILRKLPNVPIQMLNDDSNQLNDISIKDGKSVLHISSYKGQFCKACPGTSIQYICCNYQIINEMSGCPMDCSYCILQSYRNTRTLTVYVNYDKIFSEIDALIQSFPERIIRIGTGELADSMALEGITGLSGRLLPYFRSKKNVFFEIKTKTNHINFLTKFAQQVENVVFSLSINPDQVVEKYELRADSFGARLGAAQKAQELGFKLAFHFDPIIHHRNWEENYSEIIAQLFGRIESQNIVWISIGGLRFPTELRDTMRERFPKTKLIRDEQIIGHDQKIRYFKPLRLEMFKHVYSQIRQYSADVFVYFCMESKGVWQRTMGFSPQSSNHLDYLFAESLYRRFPEMNLTKPELDSYLTLPSKHNQEFQQSM